MTELDPNVRSRLRQLALEEKRTLGEIDPQRIADHIVQRGPIILRRARRRQVAVRVGTTGVLIAGCLLAWRVGPTLLEGNGADHEAQRPLREAPVAIKIRSESTEAEAGAARPVEPAAPRLKCETWASDASTLRQGRFVRGRRRSTLDLGQVAFAVGLGSADATLGAIEPCELTIHLRRGTVVVHARDLEGGTLRVRTPHADVVVTGTVFAVTAWEAKHAVQVEVAEGRVRVDTAQEEVAIGPSQVLPPREESGLRTMTTHRRLWILRQVGLSRLDTPRIRAQELSPPSEEVPIESPAPPGADALVTAADRLRRAGRLDQARALYRQAGVMSGPTAQAAWLALARLELEAGRAQAAVAALDAQEEKFQKTALGPEVAWVRVRALRRLGRQDLARQVAQRLIETWPTSPQAAAARRWLGPNQTE